MSEPTRQLAAIMFTDIVGYTALMGKDSKKALELIRINRDIQKPLIEKYNGKWLKEMGDGTLSYFGSALDAVNCSIEIQELARTNLDGKMRIGIHLGDVSVQKDDVYGDGVNIASRLESISDPGGIYISDAIKRAIQGQSDVPTKYLGEIKLKNVSYRVGTYALQGKGLPAPELKHLSGHFWSEILRRNVIRAAATYIMLSILLVLQLPYLGTFLDLPQWFTAALLSTLILGFAVAMFLAWSYELSPDGFVRTSSLQSWHNPYTESQKKPLTYNFLIIGMILIILIMYVYPRYIVSDAAKGRSADKILTRDNSIAVIPFSNMSTDKETQYFADGQMEAILNHLTKIADLRVISRTTMMGYRGTTKSIPDIGKELGARYVLEGSVQKSSQKVRITAQLIDAESDRHLWSENYDRDLTDIFNIQTEIAISVAKELSATISTKEQKTIESVPTSDLKAYDYYLRGMDFKNRSYAQEDLRFATQMFQQAVEIDPNFTLAWLGLANTARLIYVFHYDESEGHLAKAKHYLDKAMALDPDLMEVQLETALYYYHIEIDFPRALQILKKIKSNYPKNPELYLTIGAIHRRLGQFEIAYRYLDSAISINPSGWTYWDTAGETLIMLRRYKKAEVYLKKVIDLNPSSTTSKLVLALMYLTTGETEKAKTLMLNNPKIDHPTWYRQRTYAELIERNYREAIGIFESSPHEINSSQFDYIPKSLGLAMIYYVMSEEKLARKHFQSARKILEAKLIELPDDARLFSSLGVAYAGLGMKEEALAAGNKSLSLMNISIDALRGFTREMDMSVILVMTGKYDEAITKLEFLLGQNGFISVELLKNDPIWEPLKNRDAFKALIKNPKYQIRLDEK